MDISFSVGETTVVWRDGELVATNPTGCTHYTINLTITGHGMNGLGDHSAEVPPKTEAVLCALSPVPGQAYRYGYQYSYSTRTVAENAGPVEQLDSDSAHAAAQRRESVKAIVNGSNPRHSGERLFKASHLSVGREQI